MNFSLLALLLHFVSLVFANKVHRHNHGNSTSNFATALNVCLKDVTDNDALIIVDSKSTPSFKISLYHPKEDIYISKVVIDEQSEMHMIRDLELLREALKKKRSNSNIIVDVGANIGIFSLYFARLGYNLISFEPLIENFKKLSRSACINNVMYGSHLAVKNNIVSDVAGVFMEMLVDPSNRGHSVVDTKAYSGSGGAAVMKTSEKIASTTLDNELLSLCAANGPPLLLKIDVEGFEGFVLKGAFKTLSECPPNFIFIEIQKNLIDAHQKIKKDTLNTIDIFLLLKKNDYELVQAENGRKNTSFWKSDKQIAAYVDSIDSWGDYLFEKR